jgi:hypothetical protein
MDSLTKKYYTVQPDQIQELVYDHYIEMTLIQL